MEMNLSCFNHIGGVPLLKDVPSHAVGHYFNL